jgi:Leucine Rich repeat
MGALYACFCAILPAGADSLDAFLVRVKATAWPVQTKTAPARIERDDVGNIVGLRLDGVRLQPGDIEQITSFTHLDRLSLNRTTINDDDLRKLATLRKLRSLTLNNTSIGDKGVEALADFPNLRRLCLGGVKATHQSVRELKAKRKELQLGYVQSKE